MVGEHVFGGLCDLVDNEGPAYDRQDVVPDVLFSAAVHHW